MIRNIKILGFALAAVFALSAVAASAASAQNGILTSTGPVTLRAVNEAGQVNALTAFGTGVVACPNAVYTGHENTVTPHKFIKTPVSAVTITPHYGVCVFNPGNLPMTMDMNGCDYELQFLETTGGEMTYGVRTTVVCPKEKHITLTIFSNAANHTANKPFCHTTITENAAGYLGLHVTDLTNGHLTISGTIEGITAHKTGGGVLCPAETDPNVKLDLSINVEGRNEAGTTTAISLSHL